MLLKNKTAVIYGAGGAIGGTVARAFAREGANVFLTGRSSESLKTVLDEILASGGKAEASVVDASHEHSVNRHLNEVVEKEGSIDISFNAIGIPQTGIQGIPLLTLEASDFMLPINTYAHSHFITARGAARHMTSRGGGVILTLTATPSRIAAPLVGGMAAAWSAIEALTRCLAAEVGTRGVRVVCLRTDALPETGTITEVFGLHAKGAGLPSHKEFQSLMEGMTLLKRLPALSEIAGVATFVASDQAKAMTGTVVNVSCGAIVD
jgi:NAD(P)-dependent dehydrogenase (short-subunit alcohol dehydrogenase family)